MVVAWEKSRYISWATFTVHAPVSAFESFFSSPPSPLSHLCPTTLHQFPPSTTTQPTPPTMDSNYRENAGRAHYEVEQNQQKEDADRAKTLRFILQKKLGEDITTSSIPGTTPQTGKPSLVYQASGSSPGQPTPYSRQEWTAMQKAYDLGREREREETERQRADREQNGMGYGLATGARPGSNTPMRGYGGNARVYG
jgi:uncharacterized protein YecE (DUF72 family)